MLKYVRKQLSELKGVAEEVTIAPEVFSSNCFNN